MAVFGTGCFWCSEAVFSELKGVLKAEPGYMGGDASRANYGDVSTGTTGHAEVTRVAYDPRVISFSKLLDVFWATHDPTSLNRQGGDMGPQYRSVIFCQNLEQQVEAEQQLQKLDRSGRWKGPIVTQIQLMGKFFPAEEHHHFYYRKNPEHGYCNLVIQPKLEKFRLEFKNDLK